MVARLSLSYVLSLCVSSALSYFYVLYLCCVLWALLPAINSSFVRSYAGEWRQLTSTDAAENAKDGDDDEEEAERMFRPRLCELRTWSDFDGFGFQLHANDQSHRNYIDSVEPGSPADAVGKYLHSFHTDRETHV